MKHYLSAGRALGAALFLAVLGAVAWAGSGSLLPLPGTNGPSLGDPTTNVYSITQALIQGSGNGYTNGLSVSQTDTQAACTQLNLNIFQEVKTSAATGSVCLPGAFPGKNVLIGNASGQTIHIYGAPASSCTNAAGLCSFVSGTQDTINGTAGSSSYNGLTSGKNVDCFAPVGGAWYCTAGN